MSELILQGANGPFRRNLLVTASALELSGAICATNARGAEDERPTVWIELGGQLERLKSDPDDFMPPFFNQALPADLATMREAEKLPAYMVGGEGKLTFKPGGTDWVFSASVRYGRANAQRHKHHESAGLPKEYFTLFGNPLRSYTPAIRIFGDGQSASQDTHLVLDFQAGKDVGLGLFGTRITGTVNAGIRFAQFTSKTDLALHARQGDHVVPKYYPGLYHFSSIRNHNYSAVLHAERNTRAIGPAVSWDASLPLAGSDNGMSIALDWGVNGAILFGRQYAAARHQTGGVYRSGINQTSVASYANGPYSTERSRSVIIPNVGGFAGVSFRYTTAKIALGYRADFFFNAMDVGNDTRQSRPLGLYGPFATISIGLGG